MDYWAETMQDDVYLIAAEGWKAETYRIIEKDKKGKEKDKGWACNLAPKPLIVARYYAKEQAAIDALTAEVESVTARLAKARQVKQGMMQELLTGRIRLAGGAWALSTTTPLPSP